MTLKRIGAVLMLAVALFALPVITDSFIPTPEIDNPPKAVIVLEYEGRQHYQTALNTSLQRFEPAFNMIVINGRAYMRTDREVMNEARYCTMRCGTLSKAGNVYHVSLPVGYVQNSNVVPAPRTQTPITSLTFWSPITHRPETIISETSAVGVALPAALLAYRSSADLKPGESAYTTASFIRKTDDGRAYLIDGTLAYEPIGLDYGYTIDTVITRKTDGTLEAKPPANFTPIISEGMPTSIATAPVAITL